MKTLVIGYGSIGKRHARLLAEKTDVAVVSSQSVADHMHFKLLDKAIDVFAPDRVVIANITATHAHSLDTLKTAGFPGHVLVEKPLFAHAAQNNAPYPFPIHIAYQLRFHPVIRLLREALNGKKALSAHIYAGQHLSGWRAGREVKKTYSAVREQGGGVMRDLSHELDLVQYLLGPIEQSYAIAARAGDVTVDSEDAAAFALACRSCPVVSLQMNYLDRVPRREWIINTADASMKADLIAGAVSVNRDITQVVSQADDAYRAMHEAWLSGGAGLCSFDEAMAVVTLIDKVAV